MNIFTRINSGGTALGFSDILMSIAIASWKQKDARKEINDLVDQIRNKGFNINKDYILKAFLYLYHKDVRFRITSFKDEFISSIETNWDSIRNAILDLFTLMKSYGLNDYTLTTHNATLPILYYIYHKDIFSDFSIKVGYKEDREIIRKWLFTILIRRTFGAQTDTVLSQSRKAFVADIDAIKFDLTAPSFFPAEEINKQIRKIGEVGDDFIEELLLSQKDSQYSFPVLALLYPELDYRNNSFHQDHIHPAASYEQLTDQQQKDYGWKVYNSVLNLQMLDANENMSKNDKSLKSWVADTTINSDRNRFLENHIIPDVDLDSFEFSAVYRGKKETSYKENEDDSELEEPTINSICRIKDTVL